MFLLSMVLMTLSLMEPFLNTISLSPEGVQCNLAFSVLFGDHGHGHGHGQGHGRADQMLLVSVL